MQAMLIDAPGDRGFFIFDAMLYFNLNFDENQVEVLWVFLQSLYRN